MLLTVTSLLSAYAPLNSFAARNRVAAPRSAVRLFDEPAKTTDFELPSAVTRSQNVGAGRKGSVFVTDSSGSFYESREMFNTLYDFGGFASLTASSASTAEAKKMLISRKARYSGLLDALASHAG